MQSPLPPRCAARFRPLQRLAEGGFGAVWLAVQEELDRKVALKVLHREVVEDADTLARFENEAQVTAGLRHENIVVVIDHGIEDGVPWIAYEYVPGQTLREVMSGTQLRVSRVLRFARQVAAALEEAHRHGVLHRDIKPENLLVPRGDDLKVADFGLARRADAAARTRAGLIVGTPGYIAPERVRGEPPAEAADVYAVGVLMYEMLTAELPFPADTPLAMFERQVREDPPAPSLRARGVPPAVDNLVLATLARDPRARLPSAAELRRRIDELRDQLGIAEETATMPRDALEASRRVERPTRSVPLVPRAAARRPTLTIAGKVRPVLLTLTALLLVMGAVGLRARDARPAASAASAAPSSSSWTDPRWRAIEAALEPLLKVREDRAATWAQAPAQIDPEMTHADATLRIAERFEVQLTGDLLRLKDLEARAQAILESPGGRTPYGRVLEARLHAHHFMLEHGRERNRIIKTMLEDGAVNTPADFMEFLAALEGKRSPPVIAVRLQRAAEDVASAVQIVCESPGEGGEHLPVLYEDLRWMSYWLYSAGRAMSSDPGIVKAVRDFSWRLDQQSGSLHAPACRAAKGVWSWGRLGSRTAEGRRSLEDTLVALEILIRAIPRAKPGLEAIAARMRREIAGHERARAQRR